MANSPKVPLAFRVITSGTSFLTSRVRSAVSGSAGLSTTTRMSGFSFSNCSARSWKYAWASGLNWKNVMTVRPPSPLEQLGEERGDEHDDADDGARPAWSLALTGWCALHDPPKGEGTGN